jgi:hypothetical protein
MGGWVIFWVVFLLTALSVLDMGRKRGRHE